MTQIHGFELLQQTDIPELNSVAKLYRHVKTGAELLSVEADDENKVFGVSFRTPPEDSTGLPHILEHVVLGGSKKYPVKSPILELYKGSMQTFVNALTYPDKTIYPVASTNLQDFYNLADVYLDAVFHPNITPQTLQQEGWHLELDALDEPLIYKGVVFNEMKGAYSSPDDTMARYNFRSLLPDTPYQHDSGGDPRAIPDLTYEQFKRFYDTYYHPSNARIWFYGDDDPTERLRRVDAVIGEFDGIEVTSTIPVQPPLAEPARVSIPYDASDDSEGGQHFVAVNWLLPDPLDANRTMAFEILGHVLLGTPAAPLRKALIESGLGEDLIGGGLNADLRQMTFSTGLRGVNEGDVSKVEALILDTLRDLAENGIDPAQIAASLNTLEFRMRELNFGPYPRGVILMMAALTTWNYDGDPVAALAFEGPLAAFKAALESDSRYLEGLVQQHFLDNQHRSTVVLEPDPELRARHDAEEKARLADIRAGMSEAELQAVIDSTQALRQRQQTPDSPESLATIPHLTLDDLDKENKTVPLEASRIDGAEILFHDLFTNGIIYLDVGFDLHTLPAELLPYVPLFSRALLEMGTEEASFVQLSQRIGAKTGGIRPDTFIASSKANDREAAWLFLRGKATPAQAGDLLDILRDVLLTANFDDRDRFRQMVLESKAGSEAGLIPMGHMVIARRLAARYSVAGWLNETLEGVDSLFFTRELAAEVESDWSGILAKLERIRELLFNRQAMLCNITVDADNWAAFQPKLSSFISALPSADPTLNTWQPTTYPANEGLTIPAQVNYVGKGANLYDLGYEFDSSSMVITKRIALAYLFENVRVQGGAYGGFCIFDHQSGIFRYLSYRDPNLMNTVRIYDGTADFVRDLQLDDKELTRSIIAAISDMDTYQLPDAKGYSSMARYLIGYTDEKRQQHREQLLATTAADFRHFAEALAPVTEQGQVVVLGSAEAINAANAEMGGDWLDVTRVL